MCKLTEHFGDARVGERFGDVGSARSYRRLAPATGPFHHAPKGQAPSGVTRQPDRKGKLS